MSKSNPSPMTRTAVSRIASAEAKSNAGQIRAGSFATRADAVVQRGTGVVARAMPSKK